MASSDDRPDPVRLPDLNCDLGEGEPPERTRTLMALIDRANIACGGHAGDDTSMRECLRLAREFGVRPGAHPGLAQPSSFGRGPVSGLSPGQLVELMIPQVDRLQRWADVLGVPLAHLKLHGALYHAADADPAFASAFLDTVARRWPGMAVIARAGGGLAAAARGRDLVVLAEGFLDRGYRDDGTLVPRGEPDALVPDSAKAVARLRSYLDRGGWSSVQGRWLPMAIETLCVHGDSPEAPALLAAVRSAWPEAWPRRSRSVPGRTHPP